MIKRKGMTMAIQIVIVIIVLVVLALLVIGITRGQLFGGLGFLQNKGDQQDCLSSRDIYCQNEPTGCWDGSKEVIRKSPDDEGKFCNEVLNKRKEASFYSCQYKEYFADSAYPILQGVNTTAEYYLEAEKSSDNVYKGYLKEICRGLGFYFNGSNSYLNCTKSKSEQTADDIVDLSFMDRLRCNSLN